MNFKSIIKNVIRTYDFKKITNTLKSSVTRFSEHTVKSPKPHSSNKIEFTINCWKKAKKVLRLKSVYNDIFRQDTLEKQKSGKRFRLKQRQVHFSKVMNFIYHD